MKRFVLLLIVLMSASVGYGANMAHSHLKHVYKAWGSNPNGVGFMPLAFSEVTKVHDQLQAISNSSTVKGSMFGELANLLEGDKATEVFGVTDALSGMVKHTALSALSVDSSKNVVSYAESIATCANNAIRFAKAASATARQLQSSNSAIKRSALNTLSSQVRWIYQGRDVNGDGVISTSDLECGLRQADVFMSALKHLEGLDD